MYEPNGGGLVVEEFTRKKKRLNQHVLILDPKILD